MVTVEIRNLPVGLFGEASEHNDELRRELALLDRGSPDDNEVPARLAKLVTALQGRFGSFGTGQQAAVREARRQGRDEIDVTYRVPVEIRSSLTELATLLDEADEFCRRGSHLLTLATPEGPLAFRRWFLGEFVAQIDGNPPTPWPQFARSQP